MTGISKNMLRILDEQRSAGMYCDVKILAAGDSGSEEPIKAHKGILAARSSYFAKILKNRGDDECVRIPDVDYPTLRYLVDFLYADDFNVSPLSAESVKQILDGAVHLELVGFEYRMCQKLREVLDSKKSLELINILLKKNHKATIDTCKDVLAANMKTLKTTELMNLDFDVLEEIINRVNSNPNVTKEHIFEVVFQWMNSGNDAGNRNKLATPLLRSTLKEVNFMRVEMDFLNDARLQELTIPSSCMELIMAMQQKLRQNAEEMEGTVARKKPKNEVVVTPPIISTPVKRTPMKEENGAVVSPSKRGRPKKLEVHWTNLKNQIFYLSQGNLCCFDLMDETGSSDIVVEYQQKGNRRGHSLAHFKNKLYILGGINAGRRQGVKRFPEIFVYDLVHKRAEVIPEMIEKRCNFQTVVVGNCLYAIGGSNELKKGSAFNCVEKIDLSVENPVWEEADFLLRCRDVFGVGILQKKIFVVGGYRAISDDDQDTVCDVSNSMESYDIATDAWTEEVPMPTPRAGLCVAVVGSELFAMGGGAEYSAEDEDKFDVVEIYDSKLKLWRSGIPMLKPRQHASAVVCGQEIFVIGGDADGSIEKFDISTQEWSLMPCNKRRNGDFASVVYQKD